MNALLDTIDPVYQWTHHWAVKNKIPAQFLEKTSSTNDHALSLKNSLKKPFFLFCSQQTKSRGRDGKKWMNSDFMGTWTWKQKFSPHPVLSPYLGWIFYKNSLQLWPQSPWALKAPNDLYLGDKKVLGILLEVVSEHPFYQIVIGVGANILKTPSSQWAYINQYAEVNLDKWCQFLHLFWNDLLIIQKNSILSLSSNQTQTLTKALQKHKNYKNLKEIKKNGDLVFENHLVPWTAL